MSAARPCNHKQFYIYSDGTHTLHIQLHRSLTTSFVFPSSSIPLQLLFLIIGRNWLVGFSGPLIFSVQLLHTLPCKQISKKPVKLEAPVLKQPSWRLRKRRMTLTWPNNGLGSIAFEINNNAPTTTVGSKVLGPNVGFIDNFFRIPYRLDSPTI